MSSFYQQAINPTTGQPEQAEWIDTHRGYFVRFQDGSMYHENMIQKPAESQLDRLDEAVERKHETSSYHKDCYGLYAGNLKGVKCYPDQCAYEVIPSGKWFEPTYQCSRKRGHGPEQAFCKQHAKKYEG